MNWRQKRRDDIEKMKYEIMREKHEAMLEKRDMRIKKQIDNVFDETGTLIMFAAVCGFAGFFSIINGSYSIGVLFLVIAYVSYKIYKRRCLKGDTNFRNSSSSGFKDSGEHNKENPA